MKILKSISIAIISILLTALTAQAITLWYLDGTTLKPVDDTWTVEGMAAGNVLSVGDCVGGACLDGSADGGSYIRIYDGDSNYAELNLGNIASDYTVYLPLTTGTLIHTEADPLSATKALNNLASVAINESLISDAADTDDLGSATYEWRSLYLGDAGKLYFGLGQDGSIHRNAANELTITATAGVTVSNDFTATTLYGDGSNITDIGSAAATALTEDAKAAENIAKGQCVYFSGAVGQFPQASLCDNTNSAKHDYIGIAAETKTTGQTILIRTSGKLTGVDTDGTGTPGTTENWADGDTLYMSTSGNLTNVAPTSGTVEEIAIVSYAHGTTGILNTTRHDTHNLITASGEDILVRMGDSAATNTVSFRDYANAEVGSINSDGLAIFKNIQSSGYFYLNTNESGFYGPNTSDGDYMTFDIRDSDTDALVIVGGMFGAANPYFSLGGASEFRFYNEGHALAGLDERFQFGDTGVYIFSDDDGYLDLTADLGIRMNATTTFMGVADFGVASTTNATTRYYNSTNGNIVTLQSGATSGSYTLTLPLAVAGAGEVLTDAAGNGVLSWSAVGSGDVLSVGDCLSGICLDGTDDGGSYINIYDGDSDYTSIVSSNVATTTTITLPATTGTLALLDSPTFTTAITVPNDSISHTELSEGDAFVFTGSVAIPQGDPTIDGVGEIGIDTTSDQFLYYGGAERIMTYEKEICFALEDPVDADDNMSFFFPKTAITITDVYCQVEGTASTTIAISDGTNALESIVCDADGAEDDGSIANGAFTARERMEFDLDATAGTPTLLNTCITYTITAD